MTSEVISTGSTRQAAAAGGEPRARGTREILGSVSTGALILSFVPMAVFHLRDVWARPHYEFLPLLVPAAAALLWQRCRNLGTLEPGNRWVALGLLGFVWLLLAGSILFVTSWLGGVSTLLVLLVAAYAYGGTRLVGAVLPAWVMLAMAVPPPFHLDARFVGALQALVSQRSSDLLDVLGITHVMEGNVIDLGSRPLLVDQACSGIYSLFTLGICTLFYMMWTRASWPRLILVLTSALVWVILGNILRVVAIAVLFVNFNIDATAGKKHTALGLAGFLLMLAAVACTDRLVMFGTGLARLARSAVYGTRRKVSGATWNELLFHWNDYIDRWETLRARRVEGKSSGKTNDRPASSDRKYDSALDATIVGLSGSPKMSMRKVRRHAPVPTGPTRWPRLAQCWVGRPIVALAFLVLLPPQLFLPGHSWSAVLANKGVESRTFGALERNSLPERTAGFTRTGFAPVHRDHDLTWGEESRVWAFDGPPGRVTVSLDYPFVGWHELTECYNGRGWRVVGRTTTPDPSGGETVTVDLTRDDGRYLRVVYGLFDRNRHALTPPYTRLDLTDLVRRRLALWGVGATAAADMVGPTHQIQVVFESIAPLSPETGAALMQIYRDASAAIHANPLAVGPAEESKS